MGTVIEPNELLEEAREEISGLLNQIAAFFKNPAVTLVVRNPDHGDADFILTSDDPALAIVALQKRGKPDTL